MTKRGKQIIIFLSIFTLLVIPLASAGFFDWYKKVTGEAVSQVDLNISVGGGTVPVITFITNLTAVTLTEGPSTTAIYVNFTATDADGAGNLDDSTAAINFTRTGETTRYNSTCTELVSSGNEANYSCVVTMYWFDEAGAWTINASIADFSSNVVYNDTSTVTLNTLTGFSSSPSVLTFSTINAGSSNNSASNNPLLLNNTGNQAIAYGGVKINATNLVGETTSSLALYSGNFSVGNLTGSSEECDSGGTTASLMNVSSGNFANVAGAILGRGDFTINDGTAQEQLYVCLTYAGSELTQQAYSTAQEGSWTIEMT